MIRDVPRRGRAPLWRLWRRYLRLRRIIRWPLTTVTLVLLAVIFSNLIFGSAIQREVATVEIPPGETVVTPIQIDPGRLVAVRWQLDPPFPDSPIPLRVRLQGPSNELPRQSQEQQGSFQFKAGFTRSRYQLALSNGSRDASARVTVRWPVR